MLRGTASRLGPLALGLREGAHLKRGVGKRYYTVYVCFSLFEMCILEIM